MKIPAMVGAFLVTLLLSSQSFAQFNGGDFFGGGVAYNPEISVVSSGAVLDAQATVSADRKYVTLNVRTTLTHLNSLVPFTVASTTGISGGTGGGGVSGGGTSGGGIGFVGAGLIDDPNSETRTARPTSSSHVQTSPTEILKIDPTIADSILRRQGMLLLQPIH